MLLDIIFLILLIDAVGAIAIAIWGEEWYMHHFRTISRLFPATIGWAVYYLVLVLWIGFLTYR